MNMAETGHATWVKAGAIQLTLVDAARHDVGENLRLEKSVKRFLEGTMKSTGKGPSSKEVDKRSREGQLERARSYGKEILADDFEGDPYSPGDAAGFVDPGASHSPTKRGKRKKSSKSSKGQFGKQLAKSLECAKTEASDMHLDGMVQIATDHNKFIVKHGQTRYEVDICHTPSCSCPDRRPCHCKHVLWVFLYVLNVREDDPLLQEKRPTKDALRTVLSRNSSQAPSVAPVSRTSSASSAPILSQTLSSTSDADTHVHPLTQSGHTPSLSSAPLPAVPLPYTSSTNSLAQPSTTGVSYSQSQPLASTSQPWALASCQSSHNSAHSMVTLSQPPAPTSTSPQSLIQVPPAINLPRPSAGPGYYIMTLLNCCHSSVSVCFGCQQPFRVNGMEPPPPFDLLMTTHMKREYFQGGMLRSKMGNVYFHASMNCILARIPFFHSSMLQLQPGLYPYLLPVHKEAVLTNFSLTL